VSRDEAALRKLRDRIQHAGNTLTLAGEDLAVVRNLVEGKLYEIQNARWRAEEAQERSQRDYWDRRDDDHVGGCSGPG